MTQQEVDAAIAKLRGWVYCEMSQYWLSPPSFWTDEEDWYTGATCDNDGRIPPRWDCKTPPPYCSSWALAGPLLDEMMPVSIETYEDGAAYFDMDSCAGRFKVPKHNFRDTSLTECIARLWLEWRDRGNGA